MYDSSILREAGHSCLQGRDGTPKLHAKRMPVVALGRVFSEYFGITCQFSLHKLLHVHYSSSHRRCIVSILRVPLNNQPIN
jgi:hypothetical protein